MKPTNNDRIHQSNNGVSQGNSLSTSTAIQLNEQDGTAQASETMEDTQQRTIEQFINSERSRLSIAREEALEQRAAVEARIAAIDVELSAIDAYEAVKSGKPPRNTKIKTRRTGRRAEVLEVIKQHPQGITRGEILIAMEASDKKSNDSISNALAALNRADRVTLKNGVYSTA